MIFHTFFYPSLMFVNFAVCYFINRRLPDRISFL